MILNRALALGIFLFGFASAGCSSSDDGPSQILSVGGFSEPQSAATQPIGITGGTLAVPTGTLVIPPGAVLTPRLITFSSQIVGTENRVEITGVSAFLVPCVVTLQIPPAGGVSKPVVRQIDGGLGQWLALPFVTDNGWAIASILAPRPLRAASESVSDQ